MQTIPGGIFILFFKASLGRVRARLIASFCFSAFVIWISFPTAVLADGPTATATPVAAQTSQANTNTNASDSSAGKTISSAPVVTATPAPAQNATTTLANATPDSKSTDASTTTSSAKETKSAVSSPTSTSSPTQNSNQNKIQTTATSVASPSPQPTQTAAKTSAPISTQNEVANPKRDAVPDPYITFDGVTYRFLSDCTGFSNCTQSTTPIQAAVNYFAQNSSVIAANDRTIFVDGGTYKENISINGINALAVRGSVNGARSVIDGSVTIANSVGINLLQFTVTRGIQVAASKDVTLSNVVAQNSGGNPALSISKSNTITLNNVTASGNNSTGAVFTNNSGPLIIANSNFNNNNGAGLSIENHDGDVRVQNSAFNFNQADGLIVIATGNIILENVQIIDNGGIGASLRNDFGNGDISLNLSTLEGNRAGDLDYATNGNISVVVDDASITSSAAGSANLLANLPYSFELNQGQADSLAKFIARGRGYTLSLTQDSATLTLRNPQSNAATALQMKLVDANPQPNVVGLNRLPGIVNYFIGNDPAKWQTNIPTFSKVRYQNIYPGIDLIYYGNGQKLEYDLVVAPSVDPSAIQLKFDGAESVRLDANGDLLIGNSGDHLRLRKPVVYQEISGTRKAIRSGYTLEHTAKVLGFNIGEYDAQTPLVIDPVLAYSTFFGGSQDDIGFDIALGNSDEVYVVGSVRSSNLPTTVNAYDTSANGNLDAFVFKLNIATNTLIYATYVGGSGDECEFSWHHGCAIAVDSSGNAYIAGITTSNDFPVTTGAYDTSYNGGGDVFVLKLNSLGTARIYATFLGGSNMDMGADIAIDSSGFAFVVGSTESNNFPTTAGAYDQNPHSAPDAFITKILADGSNLSFSTYLGGNGWDSGQRIAIDSSGNVYVTGQNSSSDFPTTLGAYDTTYHGSGDTFVAKMNSAGSARIFVTNLGGSGGDIGYGIAVDGSGNVYVTGYTSSSNFPTTVGAFDRTYRGNGDAFVAKLNSTGSTLTFSTFVGGNNEEGGSNIAIDASGNIYVTGPTSSSDFPTTASAYDSTHNGGTDVYVFKLNYTGSALNYSTFLGGNGDDAGSRVVVDGSGNIYVVGNTNSSSFPQVNPYQSSIAGAKDVFVSKITQPQVNYSNTIYFASNRTGSGQVYKMNTDGTTQTRLTFTGTSGGPAASPDGTKLAFVSERSGVRHIYVINVDGTNEIQLTTLGANNEDPVWSPDGNKIAFWSNRDGNIELYVSNADGTNQQRLTNSSPASERSPSWSPDGRHIVYIYSPCPAGPGCDVYDVYVMDADGNNARNLTSNAADDIYPKWSPDGNRIAFSSNRDGRYAVFLANPDGTNLVRLTNNLADDKFPAWSPNGLSIAFESNRDCTCPNIFGPFEIYLMNADGTNQTRLTNDPSVDGNPSIGGVVVSPSPAPSPSPSPSNSSSSADSSSVGGQSSEFEGIKSSEFDYSDFVAGIGFNLPSISLPDFNSLLLGLGIKFNGFRYVASDADKTLAEIKKREKEAGLTFTDSAGNLTPEGFRKMVWYKNGADYRLLHLLEGGEGNLKLGDLGDSIAEIEGLLITLNLLTDINLVTKPTGNFSLQTELAIQNFQRDSGLAITGKLDSVTLSRILRAAKIEIPSSSRLKDLILGRAIPITKGDSDKESVSEIQSILIMLNYLNELTKDFPTGVYSDRTRIAVQRLQKEANLSGTGDEIDASTLRTLINFALAMPRANRLNKAYAVYLLNQKWDTLDKWVSIVSANEGGFTDVNENDNGKPSFGILQFRADNAIRLFDAFKFENPKLYAEFFPTNLDEQARKYGMCQRNLTVTEVSDEDRITICQFNSVSRIREFQQVQVKVARLLFIENLQPVLNRIEDSEQIKIPLHSDRSIVLLQDVLNQHGATKSFFDSAVENMRGKDLEQLLSQVPECRSDPIPNECILLHEIINQTGYPERRNWILNDNSLLTSFSWQSLCPIINEVEGYSFLNDGDKAKITTIKKNSLLQCSK